MPWAGLQLASSHWQLPHTPWAGFQSYKATGSVERQIALDQLAALSRCRAVKTWTDCKRAMKGLVNCLWQVLGWRDYSGDCRRHTNDWTSPSANQLTVKASPFQPQGTLHQGLTLRFQARGPKKSSTKISGQKQDFWLIFIQFFLAPRLKNLGAHSKI